MPDNKSRVRYLLNQLERSDEGRRTSPDRAAHLSYIDDRIGDMLSPAEARMAKEDLTRRRLQGETASAQADAISKMNSGGKVKFNKKYTSGSSNATERKKLMAEIAAIYEKYRGSKEKRKKKGFPPAVAARLKKLMAKRDKL